MSFHGNPYETKDYTGIPRVFTAPGEANNTRLPRFLGMFKS